MTQILVLTLSDLEFLGARFIYNFSTSPLQNQKNIQKRVINYQYKMQIIFFALSALKLTAPGALISTCSLLNLALGINI